MVRSIMLRISIALAVTLSAGAVLVATGSSATATQGQPVIAGQYNSATSTTSINNTGAGGGLYVFSVTAGSIALYGVAQAGPGVWGAGNPDGVHGVGAVNGVIGSVQNDDGNGVYGQNNANGPGVYGENNANGAGVYGSAPNGTGVLADSVNGTALSVRGTATFTRSGIATVSATKASVKVSGISLSPASFVLATIQGNVAGTWVRGVRRSMGTSSFTIFLNKAVAANTKVAWFVVN
jgi:hypothetical protein